MAKFITTYHQVDPATLDTDFSWSEEIFAKNLSIAQRVATLKAYDWTYASNHRLRPKQYEAHYTRRAEDA